LVRNISSDITTQELHQAFSRIGVIRDVYIPRDYHSQQAKGFAFIEYATPEMAREARAEMDRFVIRGRQLEVVFAQERRKTPNEMRMRSTGGGRISGVGGRGDFER
jgi:RNA recognition motif-containing protein